MRPSKHRLLVLIAVATICNSISYAQSPQAGVIAAFGSHSERGYYRSDCGCVFQDGSGSSFSGGLLFEAPFSDFLNLGLRAEFDTKHATAHDPIDDVVVVSTAQGSVETIPQVPVDRIGTFQFTYLSLSPYIQYEFYHAGPFIQAGPGISILLSNTFTETRHLNSTSATINGSSYSNLRFPNGTTDELIDSTSISDAKSLAISLVGSVGWNIPAWGFTIAPMLTYDYPLTTISDTHASGWKIASWYGSLAVKFGL